MTPALSVRDVCKSIGEKRILDSVSFDLQKGDVTVLLGSSGSGKTTLLRCLNGLDSIESGSIRIRNNAEIEPRELQERIGIVFQQFNLWPQKTVLENLIEAPTLVRGISHKVATESALSYLKEVGLEEKRNAYPSELSGGQQQRVSIARALMMEPEILLLDEITSALDPEIAWEVVGIIRKLAKERQRTMLVVTHDLTFARDVADTILFMDHGTIIERGDPIEVLDNPKEERTQKFLTKIT